MAGRAGGVLQGVARRIAAMRRYYRDESYSQRSPTCEPATIRSSVCPAAVRAAARWRLRDDAPRSAAVVERRARTGRRSSQFVRETTDAASPQFVPPDRRIATFDQDGTLWVEQPLYTQVMFALDRVKDVVRAQARARERGAVQDGAHRRSRGDGQAHRARPLHDRRRVAGRPVRRGVPRRSSGAGWRRRSTRSFSGPTPSSCTRRCWKR